MTTNFWLVIPAAASAFAAALVGAWIATRIAPDQFRTMVPLLLTAVLAYTLLHRDFGLVHRPRWNGPRGWWQFRDPFPRTPTSSAPR